MSFLKRKRKRQRSSSNSGGDEMCSSWYSTDPRDLPPGFTVGSMSVPYPPPYYKQNPYSTGASKKKKKKKSKSKKSPSVIQSSQWKFVHDVGRLQKSRALEEAVVRKGEGAASPPPDLPPPLNGFEQPIPDTPIPNGFHQPSPDPPVLDCVCEPVQDTPSICPPIPDELIQRDDTSNLSPKQPTDREREQCDAAELELVTAKQQPTGGEQDHGAETAQTLQVATVTESPRERRRLKLQRSCSMNDLDELSQNHEAHQTKPPNSTDQVEHVRKPRGISFDDTETELHQSRNRRPYFTHQPRSHQVLFSRTASQNRNLDALGCSPDPHKKSRSISKKSLYKPKNVEVLIETIRTGVDVNTLDEISGNAPIHAIVTGRKRKDKMELLLALMVYGKVNINLPNSRNMTALHLAIEESEEMCIRALLAFGADVNAVGRNNYTPLDLAMDKETIPYIEVALVRMGAMSSSQLIRESSPHHKAVPRLYSFAENMKPPAVSEQSKKRLTAAGGGGGSDLHSEAANQRAVMEMYRDIEVKVNQKFSLSASFSGPDESPDDAYALLIQHRALNDYNKTLRKSGIGVFSGVEGGSRILFLDGGGIKGLVQLEILMQLEKATGKKVTELFDWIVGTSTGGVIALTLVYGKKSLREIFQLYFMMKDRIFSKSRIGFGFNTEVLEEILQEYLDPDIKMTDVTHPKVLISAVKKATTNLELHFFNNCFGDEFMDFPVWKVARYTSATPMFFSECDNYIDGGVICNNPTEYGLTTIQNFFRQQGKKLPIALVVSIGTGVYPAEELGSIDLFLGIQTLTRIKKRTQNLISLLGNALVESEMVATNSHSRCQEQGIPFYRFSPKLKDVIAGSETDNEKLFNMVIQTRIDTREQGMDKLIDLFHMIARASHHLAPRLEEENVDKQTEPERQEDNAREENNREEDEEEEEKEVRGTNLNHQVNHFLKLNVKPHSSHTMLSDIEESVEASSKMSYKLRSGSSPPLPTKFVVGEELSTVSTDQTPSELEEESNFNGTCKEQTTLSQSSVAKAGDKSDFDTSSDQSVAEKGSQEYDRVPDTELELTGSHETSVFSPGPELVNSNEVAVSSSPRASDYDDDGNVVDATSCTLSSQEPPSQNLEGLKEPEEVVEKEISDFCIEVERSSSATTPPLLVEERVEPCTSVTPSLLSLQQVEPTDDEDRVGHSSASLPTCQELSSQETLKDTEYATSSLTSEPASSSQQADPSSLLGVEITSGEQEKEEEEEECEDKEGEVDEVDTDKKQQGQQKGRDETELRDSAVNGGDVDGGIIPKGSTHSSSISRESPEVEGPHMSDKTQTEVQQSDVIIAALTPDGGHTTLVSENATVPVITTVIKLQPEVTPGVGPTNGCIAHVLNNKIERESTQHEHKEVPQHYKLNVQLTPDTQQVTNCHFPYRYETEI